MNLHLNKLCDLLFFADKLTEESLIFILNIKFITRNLMLLNNTQTTNTCLEEILSRVILAQIIIGLCHISQANQRHKYQIQPILGTKLCLNVYLSSYQHINTKIIRFDQYTIQMLFIINRK